MCMHDIKQLSKEEKLNYLKNFLKWPVLKCIEGLTLTPKNCDVAMKQLKD